MTGTYVFLCKYDPVLADRVRNARFLSGRFWRR